MSEFCVYCGVSFTKLAMSAMLVDLGCSVFPSPTYCPSSDDNEHDFSESPTVETDASAAGPA